MKLIYLVAGTLGWALHLRALGLEGKDLLRRQDLATARLSTITTDAPNSSTDQATSETSTPRGDGNTSEESPKSSDHGPVETTSDDISSPTPTAKPSQVTTSILPTTSPTNTHNTPMSSTEENRDQLPLEPGITPALGIAGALLIILGAVYALIGVISRWVQIFLSSGFLASIATTALVVYVMDPPVRDAIQGGYFVAIVMTGAIFGGGALVFKEFTEGLGCLLGGFCLSMWLLTLRPGGLVSSSGGKGAVIGVFCLAMWATSWTCYTRPYGLIASTSFSGAIAFMLGIDCFTRAGMKEFWIYIWDLNDDLFPLNTTSYPHTRGIRVEIAVVIIGTIIGLLSQIKLWKVIRTKQRENEALHREDELQNDEIEAALGRHLQRQNERDKSAWERQYGDRLQSNRNTALWQDAHPEKHAARVSVRAVPAELPSPPEHLEMDVFGPKRISCSYGSQTKHQSSFTVDAIQEMEGEDQEHDTLDERQKALKALEEGGRDLKRQQSSGSVPEPQVMGDVEVDHQVSGHVSLGESHDVSKPKRRSPATLSGLTKHLSPRSIVASESREHLLSVERAHSRASSAAATLDTENEELDVSTLDSDAEKSTCTPCTPPEIVICPANAESVCGSRFKFPRSATAY